MGLEKMRFKNREGSKERKHYPYAHEAKVNISLHSIKQGHTIGLTIVTKVLGLYHIHGGILLLIWWSTRKLSDGRLHDICSSFINKVIFTGV